MKRSKHRGKDISKLRAVIALLLAGETLPARYHDHALKGELNQYRELHLEPDWLLVYRRDEDTLHLDGLGTHADLFNE